jgi:flagellar biosynthesis/type III secretory pathway M-ring protein FliF/YscJ
MAKVRFTITADYDHGDGEISPASEREINELIRENPLLAADVLRDWLHEISGLYLQAVDNLWNVRPS